MKRVLRCSGLALAGIAACGEVTLPPDSNVPVNHCTQQSDCVPNDCCGKGTGVVNVSREPSCPAPSGCPAGSPDPTNQTLLNMCGTPFCDGTGHCVVARQC